MAIQTFVREGKDFNYEIVEPNFGSCDFDVNETNFVSGNGVVPFGVPQNKKVAYRYNDGNEKREVLTSEIKQKVFREVVETILNKFDSKNNFFILMTDFTAHTHTVNTSKRFSLDWEVEIKYQILLPIFPDDCKTLQ